MRLLFDENLSPSLVRQLLDLYPDSAHISAVAGDGSTDTHIWNIALREAYVIVSKDNDFRQRSFVRGAPPKVIWLSVGNAGTVAIAKLLRDRFEDVTRFNSDPATSLLVVSPS